MYQGYFGLNSAPFSIVPDHRVVYMSASHREAVAHLLYSVRRSGGFVQLTGEVGTGKTTVCRYLLQHVPEDVDVALLVNPRIDEKELLATICDELGIQYAKGHSLRELINRLNLHLLRAHAKGRYTVLIIDEAQNLSREVLEQVRLLTNLETSTDKLLQIILIGQPELLNLLARHDLRQLSQRIIGRFGLEPLTLKETREYITYRLQQAGCERPIFTRGATRRVHRLTGGIPRLINVLCDAALMATFSHNGDKVTWSTVGEVAREVLPGRPSHSKMGRLFRLSMAPAVIALLATVIFHSWTSERVGSGLSKLWPDIGIAYNQVVSELRNLPGRIDGVDETAGVDASQEMAVHLAQAPDLDSPAILAPRVAQQAPYGSLDGDSSSRYDLVYRLGVPLKNR